MVNIKKNKGVIGILTGGGDVPGLNPAIRAVTFRALREGYQVIGLRRGWAGLIDVVREKDYDNSGNFLCLTEEIVNRAGRTGGTFLHTSRTNPAKVKRDRLPPALQERYAADVNDLTEEVLKNIDFLGIDYLIPIGGDDTLSYGVRMYQEGVKVVAIPKTMDNDVPGTDYCIGIYTDEKTHNTHNKQHRFLLCDALTQQSIDESSDCNPCLLIEEQVVGSILIGSVHYRLSAIRQDASSASGRKTTVGKRAISGQKRPVGGHRVSVRSIFSQW